jgi:predicted membrane-bound spermidine synthase
VIISILFFLSGFAGLLYQIVWLRLAFAHFGIITPVLSTVVSVFMLGLGLGAWSAGRWVERRQAAPPLYWLKIYGLIECFIGFWALAVPRLFGEGEHYLLRLGQMSSAWCLAGSTAAIAIAILPGAWFMGMTFPVMMAFVRRQWKDSQSSFSYLYRANILGALAGAVLTPVLLIEWLGFHATNRVGVFVNLINAAICFSLTLTPRMQDAKQGDGGRAAEPLRAPADPALLFPIFITGFVSMAFEVMWTRMFTPLLGTTIYAFASVLAIYLAATWLGTSVYRSALRQEKIWHLPTVYTALAFCAFLPIFFIDRRLHPAGLAAVAGTIFPFCFILGYVTPQLIDRYSRGNSAAAGVAYMANIAGCVLGPLAACYLILPYGGSKLGIIALAVLLFSLFTPLGCSRKALQRPVLTWTGCLALVVLGVMFGVSPEEQCEHPMGAVVRRDYTATVVSYGKGFDRMLLVNGVGLTVLTPLTKAMAHLPVWCSSGKPKKALVICFGMGTTYRSLLSWGLQTTAVELVPSVRDAFGYYFDDAPEVLRNPLGRIVVDDGRRFLQRTNETFDVVTLDPPPPVEAAGSGLLYSTEFYDLVKRRMSPDGVLQQWWPGGEPKILFAVAQSLHQSFPYVRVYKGLRGYGFHFLASFRPLGRPTADQCIARLTPGARRDLTEWFPGWSLPSLVQPFFEREGPIETLLDRSDPVAITDDHPVNEYYLLRRWLARRKGKEAITL